MFVSERLIALGPVPAHSNSAKSSRNNNCQVEGRVSSLSGHGTIIKVGEDVGYVLLP